VAGLTAKRGRLESDIKQAKQQLPQARDQLVDAHQPEAKLRSGLTGLSHEIAAKAADLKQTGDALTAAQKCGIVMRVLSAVCTRSDLATDTRSRNRQPRHGSLTDAYFYRFSVSTAGLRSPLSA
jgi:ethanolamine ammonia-lyase large subunit